METHGTLNRPNTDVKAVPLNDRASRNPPEEKEDTQPGKDIFEKRKTVRTQLSVEECDADAAKSNRVNRDPLAGYCRRSEGCYILTEQCAQLVFCCLTPALESKI